MVYPYKLPSSTSQSEMHFKIAARISPRESKSLGKFASVCLKGKWNTALFKNINSFMNKPSDYFHESH